MRLETYDDYCQRLKLVLDYVHKNLDNELGVQQLAEVGCMSPFHFQRVFSRLVGENCIQLVRRIRLERAAWQLQTTTRTIADIAFDACFESQEAFARSFRLAFGSPATNFRWAQWSTFHVLAPSRFHFTPDGKTGFEFLTVFGEGVPYELREVEPLLVARRKHDGAPHLLAKSSLELAKDLESFGFDIDIHPIATFAYGLAPGQPNSKIQSYVSAPIEFDGKIGLEPVQLGGGLHLVVSHTGPGTEIGDLWFRMWAEAFPASKTKLRDDPCFQILRYSLAEPGVIHTTICIPVAN